MFISEEELNQRLNSQDNLLKESNPESTPPASLPETPSEVNTSENEGEVELDIKTISDPDSILDSTSPDLELSPEELDQVIAGAGEINYRNRYDDKRAYRTYTEGEKLAAATMAPVIGVVETGKVLGMDIANVSAFQNGMTSPTSKKVDPSLAAKIPKIRERVADRAIDMVMMAFDAVQQEMVERLDPNRLARFASDMASVAEKVSPKADANSQTNNVFFMSVGKPVSEKDFTAINVTAKPA